MTRHIPRFLRATPALAALASLVLLSGCVDPIDGYNTNRRQWEVNLDSLVATEPFVRGPGDSLLARVAGEDVVFATEVQRPSFHNGIYRDAYYVTVQASRQSLSGRDYEIISLRLDAIRDTGDYQINGTYSAPKDLDSLAEPTYAAQYERRTSGGFPETYRTIEARPENHVRVARIDEANGVMVGTFAFTGYSAERDTTISIVRGAFRLQIPKRQ
jgi:hypothetical protein